MMNTIALGNVPKGFNPYGNMEAHALTLIPTGFIAHVQPPSQFGSPLSCALLIREVSLIQYSNLSTPENIQGNNL
jgi:hypothetical protein